MDENEKKILKLGFRNRLIHSRKFRMIVVGIPLVIIVSLARAFLPEKDFFIVMYIFLGSAVTFLMYNFRKSDEANIIITKQKEELNKQKEDLVQKNILVEKQKEEVEKLLLNILPSEVAEELKATGTAKAKTFSMVTVMFTDFKDFTAISEKVSAELLVDEIHTCFSAFDNIIQKYKIEKIKTIGDAYLCVSGLPVSNYTHAADMIKAAFEIRDYIIERKKEKEIRGEIPFQLRIGIHTGPVVAGIVGVRKFAYDIWGDTVNLASRMESSSEAGKVNISGATYELIKDKFTCTYRGKIQVKNKGEVDMYFAESIS